MGVAIVQYPHPWVHGELHEEWLDGNGINLCSVFFVQIIMRMLAGYRICRTKIDPISILPFIIPTLVSLLF